MVNKKFYCKTDEQIAIKKLRIFGFKNFIFNGSKINLHK